jgi:hypothetical protein
MIVSTGPAVTAGLDPAIIDLLRMDGRVKSDARFVLPPVEDDRRDAGP